MSAKQQLFFILLCSIGVALAATTEEHYETPRQRMVQEVAGTVRRTSTELGATSLDDRVMAALATVPRHAFVSPRLRHQAYANRPLPIGYGQTISQPYIVAVMTHLLQVESDDSVLEVGTGSGYQAAILATLVQHVYSIEVIPGLAKKTQQLLQRLGYTNVTVRVGDGYYGWQEQAPFDAIIVTAAASHVPPPLIKQLRPGGRMVIPVGSAFLTQQLLLIHKDQEGKTHTRQVLPVAFVPLTGER